MNVVQVVRVLQATAIRATVTAGKVSLYFEDSK